MKKILLMTLIGALSMSFIACPKKEAPADETDVPAEVTDEATKAVEGAADKAVDAAKDMAKDKLKEAGKKMPSGL